jgi:outer membrane cobalamin receptor
MLAVIVAACCLVTGQVNAPSGAPLAGAHVTTSHAQAGTDSDSAGKFSLDLQPGDYQVNVTARGYASVSVDVKVDHDSVVVVTLEPLDTGTLRTIGTVTVDGRLTPIRGTVPSITLTRSDYARLGMGNVAEGLMSIPSVTFAHPAGAAATSIQTIALRGPDPSETLIALDGQLLNDANTGDVDLSRFPIEAFSSASITEGLGPQDSEGSNTIGGALNLVALRPTKVNHFTFNESVGSFGLTDFWANETGTHGKLGYAVALDNQHLGGHIKEFQTLYTPGVAPDSGPGCLNCGTVTHIGSSISSRSALVNMVWTFNQNTDITGRVFTMGNMRDNSAAINGVDLNAGDPAYGYFIGPGNQTIAQNIRAYQLRGRTAVGAGELVGELSTSNNTVDVNGAVANPMYDVLHQDTRSNASLSWGRTFDTSDYSVGGYERYETFWFLDPASNKPGLNQTIYNLFARGSSQVGKELKLSGSVFESHYTTFGNNLDWRLGAVYDAGPSTTLRASVGTGFRAPLLIERYVFPTSQLTPDAFGVLTGQGDPSEVPEHATEFELGGSHRFSQDATLDVSLYRTNLRDPIENYYPIQATVRDALGTYPCQDGTFTPAQCTSYPINIGNVIYQGAEIRFAQSFPKEHFFLNAMYGLNVAYPFNFGSTISNPTSGGTLVNNQQFINIPQQQGSLELDWAKGDWHAGAVAQFRGNNNELHQTPFTVIDLAAGTKVNPVMDVTIVGTNIFGGGSGRYSAFGGGVPYYGVVGPLPTNYGNLPTDRLVTEPFGLKFVMTMRY